MVTGITAYRKFINRKEEFKMGKICIKKLDQDDILEIIVEHFLEGECLGLDYARACILGESGKDIRVIVAYANEREAIENLDFEEIDQNMKYNGDHSFFRENPDFDMSLLTDK